VLQRSKGAIASAMSTALPLIEYASRNKIEHDWFALPGAGRMHCVIQVANKGDESGVSRSLIPTEPSVGLSSAFQA
jgi:hypothetical protein